MTLKLFHLKILRISRYMLIFNYFFTKLYYNSLTYNEFKTGEKISGIKIIFIAFKFFSHITLY